jgi:2-alkyl-3-oxoalkanoate reductase
MRIVLAGATGAIGRPLIRCLKENGHTVFGLARSAQSARTLVETGAEPIAADALDAASVATAILRVRPQVIINELTSLPGHYTPAEMKAAAERDRKVRTEGNANLLAPLPDAGVQRYLLQSSGFWYAPGAGLADETASFAFEASPGVAAGSRTYAELESSAFHSAGQGVWSFVHIEDAAAATVAALGCAPGAYNIVDGDPVPQRVWLPAFARTAGAPEPLLLTEEEALATFGGDTVYYATRLRGASNEKAKRELHFRPRPLEWLYS